MITAAVFFLECAESMVFRMSNKNKKHKSVSCLMGFRHCILVRANPTSVVPSVTVVQMGVSFLNEKKKYSMLSCQWHVHNVCGANRVEGHQALSM